MDAGSDGRDHYNERKVNLEYFDFQFSIIAKLISISEYQVVTTTSRYYTLTYQKQFVSYAISKWRQERTKKYNKSSSFCKLCNWITEDYEQCFKPFVATNCGFDQSEADDLVAKVDKTTNRQKNL